MMRTMFFKINFRAIENSGPSLKQQNGYIFETKVTSTSPFIWSYQFNTEDNTISKRSIVGNRKRLAFTYSDIAILQNMSIILYKIYKFSLSLAIL